MASDRARRNWRRALWVTAAFPPLAAVLFAARGAWKGWEEVHPPRLPVTSLPGRPELEGFRDVSFRAADGVALRGWWRPGAGDAAVVFAHGWGANREQMLSQALPLAARGFGVLVFDLRGHGESGGRASGGDREQSDVAAATDFVAGEPGVKWVGAVGFSLGGAAVGLAAAADRRLRAIAVEGATPSLDDELEVEYRAGGPAMVRSVRAVMRLFGVYPRRVRLIDRIGSLAPRPVLLVYGERDWLTEPEEAERIRAAAGPSATLWAVPGAGHGDFETVVPGELARRLVSFFEAARASDRRQRGD
ncbi:MAG TPA: alpha/beta hydrolase [Anaeromyxobacteraceae bacterium]|nr:alpha/beta hydrolase [Anaeromyxobacteraceae bacterium]